MKSRHQSILEWLNQHEFVTVGALAKALNSSVETIRRDLKHLDRQGLLCRVHGGAKRNTVSDVGAPLNVRQRIQVQEKRNIACRAFKLLQEDMVIGIDASSTTLQLAKTLSNTPCTVVTPALPVIDTLANNELVEVIATGGSYCNKYRTFFGSIAEMMLARIQMDIAFISCSALDDNGVIWDSNENNASLKRRLMASADQVVLLIDSNKLHRKHLVSFANIGDIDVLIAEQRLPKGIRDTLDDKGVLIIDDQR